MDHVGGACVGLAKKLGLLFIRNMNECMYLNINRQRYCAPAGENFEDINKDHSGAYHGCKMILQLTIFLIVRERLIDRTVHSMDIHVALNPEVEYPHWSPELTSAQ